MRYFLVPFLLFLFLSNRLFASVQYIKENQTDTLITIRSALQMAEQRYPLLQSKQLEAKAAAQNVNVIKYNKQPAIDAAYQAGVGTANNLTGMFYPGNILPVTGPPSLVNNYTPAVGTAASLLLNWQADVFKEKTAQVNVAEAELQFKKADYQQALFQHKISIISNYLDILFVKDIVSVNEFNIARTEANLQQSFILTKSGIKPGVDTALFLSELAKAKIDLLLAKQQLQIYQIKLASLLVSNNLPMPTDTAFIHQLPVQTISTDTVFSTNPLVQSFQSALNISLSKESALKKSYLPKLNIWGTTFARGSGFETDGTIKTFDGFAINKLNYGAGVQLVFPIMKYGEVKRQIAQQNLLSKSATAKIVETQLALTTQQRINNTMFANSLVIANEAQKQLAAANYAFNAMKIRYSNGLVNYTEVIQAQYNLLKAELDIKKYYWDAWKTLLLQAAVSGNENLFLNAIK
jgi:outer membrane protein